MAVATLEELMEAGVHFGHQTKRWNPKMKPFIWGERNGIYIIDLTKTTRMLDNAYETIKQYASQGKKIVFVGTKKQASDIVEEQARRCGAFFITKRWLGGTLTNFETIRTRISKLRELEEMRDNGIFERLGKKEVAVLSRQLAKLERALGGIKDMRGLPDLIYVVDQRRELIAVQEATKAKIPIVGLVDTNCDPNLMDLAIPGNDDAIKSIRLITTKIADAVLEGRKVREEAIAARTGGKDLAATGEAPASAEAQPAASEQPAESAASTESTEAAAQPAAEPSAAPEATEEKQEVVAAKED